MVSLNVMRTASSITSYNPFQRKKTFAIRGIRPWASTIRRSRRFVFEWELSAINANIELLQQTLFSLNLLLGPSMFFSKASLLLLYIRIFSPKKSTRYATYFGLAFTFCLCLATVFVIVHYCAPAAGKPWNLIDSAIKCNKATVYGVVQGSLAVVLDLYIFILPIPVVLGLQMSSRKRIAVLAVFLTGIL